MFFNIPLMLALIIRVLQLFLELEDQTIGADDKDLILRGLFLYPK